MNTTDGAGRAEADEPLPLPWPSPDFRRLDRRQSIIAWTIGLLVGTGIAAAVIVAIVVATI